MAPVIVGQDLGIQHAKDKDRRENVCGHFSSEAQDLILAHVNRLLTREQTWRPCHALVGALIFHKDPANNPMTDDPGQENNC